MIDKKKIHSSCLELLDSKIEISKKGMEEAQASANNETKSSAGDKYETGRAMSQRERDLHARQLAELINMKKALTAVDPEKSLKTVELGALVETSTSSYYISASLGVIQVENQQIMAISAISPIAQAMLGKKVEDTFEWMKKENRILSIA
ncbi:MAG: GreA/GreB family elongation factor [Reichenbachiella sp.]|uniref:GreA/GreB family elongation factor n=1 Tax=Reichenbachiella sp. TaxID=2184521 RepID=UPI003297AE47